MLLNQPTNQNPNRRKKRNACELHFYELRAENSNTHLDFPLLISLVSNFPKKEAEKFAYFKFGFYQFFLVTNYFDYAFR